MAVYTPALLIVPTIMGNGAANIATWRKQNVAGAGTFDVHRTTTFDCATGQAVTLEVGATAADTAAQKIMDAQAITAHVALVQNWWIPVPNNSYFEGFGDTTTIVGSSSGYTYA